MTSPGLDRLGGQKGFGTLRTPLGRRSGAHAARTQRGSGAAAPESPEAKNKEDALAFAAGGAARAPPPAPPHPHPADRGGARPSPAALPPWLREMAAAPQNGSRAWPRAGACGERKGTADHSTPPRPWQHGSALSDSLRVAARVALPGHRCAWAPHAFPLRVGRFSSPQTRRRLCAGAAFALPNVPHCRRLSLNGTKTDRTGLRTTDGRPLPARDASRAGMGRE